eukprot:13346006-Ditylum_brightwellii.AAC.2
MGLQLTETQYMGEKITACVIGGTMRFEIAGLVKEKTGWGFVLKRGSKNELSLNKSEMERTTLASLGD